MLTRFRKTTLQPPFVATRMFAAPTKLTPEEQEKKISDYIEADARAYNKGISRDMEMKFATNEVTRRVRTRYAPSPTGLMHIGGLRTALYNYLFAK
jgi:hypothetical protein